MAYTKNENPWEAGDLITTTVMDNFETIYTESASYLASHNHDALYPTQVEMQAAYWHSGNDGSGSGSDADLLYNSTGNLHAASFAGLGVPTGLIVLWYGSVASILAGWQLANGTGTIDMRGKFPICGGTGSAYSVGDTGGSATFTATGTITVAVHSISVAEMGPHIHPFYDTYPTFSLYWGNMTALTTNTAHNGSTDNEGSSTAHGHSTAEGTSFTGNAVASLPYFFSLCYIQKI